MSDKKKLSFSDFVAGDSFAADTEDELEKDPVEVDDDQDEPKPGQKPKVADKKKVTTKVQDSTDDDDPDEDEPELVEDPKEKKKVESKVPPKTPKVEDPEPDEPEEEGAEDAQAFFEEVEKITGTSVEVDYGDVNPLSPQGVALRDKAIKTAALDSFLEEIETKFPQAYKALEHALNGGDITQLFSQTTGRDYSKVEIKEGDDALAKEILKEYYKSRGVKSEAKINKMIEADEDSEGGLVKEAQTALNELKEEQESQRNDILEKQKQAASEQKKKDQILVTAVDEVLESKKLGNFRIADRQEAVEFKKFVLSSIRRTGSGTYELATPLNNSELEKQLQYFYFQFKKGDLSKIVQQKAATENAKKLSLKLAAEQSKTKKSTEQESKNKMSMKDFYA